MNQTQDEGLDAIVALITGVRRVLVSTHVNPDGDAIGSELALCHLLRHLGKEVLAVNSDPVPANLRFLPGATDILPPPLPDGRFDALFLVDCGHPDRAGSVLEGDRARLGVMVNIDHHATGHPWADLNVIDPEASSTAELIYRLILRAGVTPDVSMAVCVYAGLVADTGSFRYGNTTPRVLRLAADLVAAGVDPAMVAVQLYECVPYGTLRLLGRALNTLQLTADGLVASMTVLRRDLEETGTTWDSTEEFINHARSVPGVQAAVLLKETGEKLVKASFRSRGAMDVARVALAHGGGGHRNAAGCTLRGDIETARATIVAELHEAVLAHLGHLPPTIAEEV